MHQTSTWKSKGVSRVRFRIDGVLQEMGKLSKELSLIFSRMKILGDMDIAVQRQPQDGHTTLPKTTAISISGYHHSSSKGRKWF